MGDFIGGLFETPEVSTPASGFFSQPKAYQDLYGSVLGNMNAGIGGINANMFRPMGQTADETNAFNAMRQGFAPTAQSLQQDISMFMNPFNEHVIDNVNRQATGQNSLLNQAATRAGQQGSNRAFLGANDIEQTRLNTIGNLQNQGYQSALGNVLNNLIPQRQQDAAGLLGIGGFQRGLRSDTNMAPLQALMAQSGLLGGIPTNFGSNSQQMTSGGDTDWGKIAGTVGSIFFSDRRLKQDIKHVGEQNGFNLYEFAYKYDPNKKYIGVMADEVEKVRPDAVHEVDGFKAVDYEALGLTMQEVE